MTRNSARRSMLVAVILFSLSTVPNPALARDFAVGSKPRSVAVGDFNRDGVQDLAIANAGENTVSVLLGNSDGTFQAALTFGVGRAPWAVAVGDFNRDGVQDLAVANYDSDTVSVLLGNGDGTFQAALTFDVVVNGAGGGPTSVAVGDFNRDGLPDLAIADCDTGTVSVLLGNGDGTFF